MSYVPTIGIECHVQLSTTTKLFASVANDAREAPPNTLISPVCFGLPGALPVLNREAIRLACLAAFALRTVPSKFSKFDRKHYFYPDLPLGYQITQFDQPIVLGGLVQITVDGQEKTINITRAHLEADAGKSTHPDGADYSLVDLNRAGTPLLEIVSEPEMHSSAEAKAYCEELRLSMLHAGVSDCNMYYGNMRFDVNISLSQDPAVLGTRAEIKNLNSFRSVERAIEYEIKRQTELLKNGSPIVQETRGWDDAKAKTFSQRTKEDAHDYRYFPDPDLPPVVLDDEYINNIKAQVKMLPSDIRKMLTRLSLDHSQVEVVVSEPIISDFVVGMREVDQDLVKIIVSWIAGELIRKVGPNELSWEQIVTKRSELIELAQMQKDSQLSSTAAKEILVEIATNGGSPLSIAGSKGLLQVSDSSALDGIVDLILADNPKAVEDIKTGEMKAIGFLVGQAMKLSKGQANPAVIQEIIKKKIT
jgi:aspartyl-tRNA(Asn)/glutamyl-tRNA(Gln) amidotransferase subunit B